MMYFIDVIGEIPWINKVSDEFCTWIESFRNRLIHGEESRQEFVSLLQNKVNELVCKHPEEGQFVVSVSSAPEMESYRIEVHPKDKSAWFLSLLLRKAFDDYLLLARKGVSDE